MLEQGTQKRKDYLKDYYNENKEHITEQQTDYRARNDESIRQKKAAKRMC